MNLASLRIFPIRIPPRALLSFLLLALVSTAQSLVPSRAWAQTAGAVPPKIKAVWEPMNYPDDIYLQDVYFVNDKVGWVAGGGRGSQGGFIMHTTDGGEHWNLQLGDPHSNTPQVNRLQFLDATHGWAVQAGQLMRTTDGQTWSTVGPFADQTPLATYQFVSLQDGFEVGGYSTEASRILATHDGGRSWSLVYTCAATIQVNGLTRNAGCQLHDLRFVTARVAYAVGGGDHWSVIVKTADGGATWKVIFASTDVELATTVFFTDENNGVVRLIDNRVLITSDGGQNWSGATGTVEAYIKYADPQIGWACTIEGHPDCSYTVDGGKNWNTRNFDFPADISGYSIPRRDRIFAVGDHGMIYRYRIVPADYTAKGIIDAPLMPAYGGPIVDQLQQMQTQLSALQTQLSAAAPSASAPPTQSFSQNAAAPGSFTNQAAAQGASGGGTFTNQAATSGQGFTQSAPGTDPAAQATAGGFAQDTSAAPGFAQDTSSAPTSQFIQNTCAPQVQGLAASFTQVAQQVPSFSSNYRNLNLMYVGLNMLADLNGRAKLIRDSLIALKSAPDAPTALAIIADLSGKISGANQAISTQFQNIAMAAVAGVSGVIANQAGPNQAAGASQQNANGAANGNQPAQSGNQQQNGNSAGSAAKKALGSLQKKIPF